MAHITEFKIEGLAGRKETIRKKLGWSFKRGRIDYRPDFYFISTQFKQQIVKAAELAKKTLWVGRWRPIVKCLMINVFKRGKKEILFITRYI